MGTNRHALFDDSFRKKTEAMLKTVSKTLSDVVCKLFACNKTASLPASHINVRFFTN